MRYLHVNKSKFVAEAFEALFFHKEDFIFCAKSLYQNVSY